MACPRGGIPTTPPRKGVEFPVRPRDGERHGSADTVGQEEPPLNDAELERIFREKRITVLSRNQWERIEPKFEVLERHDTGAKGEILVVKQGDALAIVEQPKPGEFVLRPMEGKDRVTIFVEQRLAAYDRIWDGCGCKIDYYH